MNSFTAAKNISAELKEVNGFPMIFLDINGKKYPDINKVKESMKNQNLNLNRIFTDVDGEKTPYKK